jgi:CheY-like chemotaxis protein
MKILILEDTGSVLYPMLDELRRQGHHVDYAFDIHEARVLYDNGNGGYACIIADLDVPGDDPTEFADGNGFAGWKWLERDKIVLPNTQSAAPSLPKQVAVIVYSAYLGLWRKMHHENDYASDKVRFISKSARGVQTIVKALNEMSSRCDK